MHVRDNLIRVVRTSDNKFHINDKKVQGRSAYLCRNQECFKRSKKIRGFEHSFKSHLASQIYKGLEDEFKENL